MALKIKATPAFGFQRLHLHRIRYRSGRWRVTTWDVYKMARSCRVRCVCALSVIPSLLSLKASLSSWHCCTQEIPQIVVSHQIDLTQVPGTPTSEHSAKRAVALEPIARTRLIQRLSGRCVRGERERERERERVGERRLVSSFAADVARNPLLR
jgi:hypothetical protein